MTAAWNQPRSATVEAALIVDGLMQQMEGFPAPLAEMPVRLFRMFQGVDNIDAWAAETRALYKEEFTGHSDYLMAVIDACALCAQAQRLPDDAVLGALMTAGSRATAAASLRFHQAEGAFQSKKRAQEAKDAQTKVNDRLRAHVLGAAAQYESDVLSGVVSNIVDRLVRIHGSAEKVVSAFDAKVEFGRDVDGVDERGRGKHLARLFGDFVRKDMKRRGLNDKDARLRFARWKESVR